MLIRIIKQYKYLEYTHGDGVNNLPIPAIVYYINTLDSQICRRGRGVPTEPTYKNFHSKKLSGERLKLSLDFLFNARIT